MNLLSNPSARPVSRARCGVTILVMAMTALVGLAAMAGAQPVTLSCLGGERLSDADLSRGTAIVVVWASWSPRSRGIVERVNALAGRWGGRGRVLTVNFQEDPPAVQAFLAGRNFAAPVCLDPDGAFSKKYNVATLPGLLVVRDGQVAYRGKLPDDADQVIEDLLR
ncbi:MAG TPA: TlpA disulfide reductase family protein [Thermoanaerobaculia bacterium]|jgi:thiol-disulfide isomerase/thioredoxin|nr:TlpA disulfide reductase family protein [Thermoanaerobaculia bacterium]